MVKDPKEDSLKDFPFYEPGKVPQYHRYHAEVLLPRRA